MTAAGNDGRQDNEENGHEIHEDNDPDCGGGPGHGGLTKTEASADSLGLRLAFDF